MEIITLIGIAGLVILGLMILLWIISLIIKDASIVDIFWGMGFVISGWVFFVLTPDGYASRKLLLMILVTSGGCVSPYILAGEISEKARIIDTRSGAERVVHNGGGEVSSRCFYFRGFSCGRSRLPCCWRNTMLSPTSLHGWIFSGLRFGGSVSFLRRSATGSSRSSGQIPPIRANSLRQVCGGIRVTPITLEMLPSGGGTT